MARTLPCIKRDSQVRHRVSIEVGHPCLNVDDGRADIRPRNWLERGEAPMTITKGDSQRLSQQGDVGLAVTIEVSARNWISTREAGYGNSLGAKVSTARRKPFPLLGLDLSILRDEVRDAIGVQVHLGRRANHIVRVE